MSTRRGHPLERMGRDFNTLFDRLWSGWLSPLEQDVGLLRLWDFDVTEEEKEIVVRAELPGFEPNELDVQLSNNVLTIKAEKEQKTDQQEEYRSFYRTVTLPAGIDTEKVQANYHNGVLELHIARAEGAQPKRVQIQGQQAGTAPQTNRPKQQANDQAGATATQRAGK